MCQFVSQMGIITALNQIRVSVHSSPGSSVIVGSPLSEYYQSHPLLGTRPWSVDAAGLTRFYCGQVCLMTGDVHWQARSLKLTFVSHSVSLAGHL
jgi:hypothetical protein